MKFHDPFPSCILGNIVEDFVSFSLHIRGNGWGRKTGPILSADQYWKGQIEAEERLWVKGPTSQLRTLAGVIMPSLSIPKPIIL
jgi:hypothetical protein